MSFRPLTHSEITALENQGCYSSDWSKIGVSDPFSTDHIHYIRFLGEVKIGKLGGVIKSASGEHRTSGLYNSKIEQCEIGDDVLVDHVQHIRNYRVQNRVILENARSIAVNEPSSFGNGYEIEVLNEGGGRELKIFERLSAQLAYMVVSYRHDQKWIESVNGIINEYTQRKTSPIGTIGTGATIQNCGTISEVNIGESAVIRGVSLLQNGTIASNHYAPAYVGEDVIAKNFIVLSGSRIDGGALVDKCFIGQGVELGKQFSAENSVFFANTEAFHGEAVSLFAGPYTVTHHKSTLLIAGMFSFFNAGSGTNQSNHMYKLGPIHQGVVERGSKTGSFAYLLWPGKIGAYSMVMGKNMASFDTSDFPFSFINVDQEKSILTPGMNLFSVGTRRDSEKWPKRDRRKDPEKLDLINFDFLSPYIIQKVLHSLDILETLYEKTPRKQETVFHKGIRIKRLMLKSTRKYYALALNIFVGKQLTNKLEAMKGIPSIEKVREEFSPGSRKVTERWIDMAGMIAADHSVQNMMEEVKSGKIRSTDEISARLNQIHSAYENDAWDWTANLLSERFEMNVEEITTDQLLDLITLWETETIKLDKMILNDASKEFDNSSKLGFGIDGDQEVADRDFEAVRGVAEENNFIIGIRKEMAQTEARATRLRTLLGSLSG